MELSVRRAAACFAISVVLFFECLSAADERTEDQPSRAIEIVSIAKDGVILRIRNIWNDPVSIWICDSPQRLNGHGFEIQQFDGKEWQAVKPVADMVMGDLPPKYMQIEVGRTVEIPVRFSPGFLGIKDGMKLRIVVRTAHTETSLVLGTPVDDGKRPAMHLVSSAFVFLPTPRDTR
jgi:hypothetical protein